MKEKEFEKQVQDHIAKLSEIEFAIFERILNHQKTTFKMILSQNRSYKSTLARYLIMYVLHRTIKDITLLEIGRKVRLKPFHHTTVIHGLDIAKNEIKHNSELELFISTFFGMESVNISTIEQFKYYNSSNYKIIAYKIK